MCSSKIEILNSQNFSDHVFSQKELTIVRFHDEDNASCQIMESVFLKLQKFYEGKVVCFTLNKSEAFEIWNKYQIHNTPSYLIIKNEKTVEKICGLISYDKFKTIINTNI